MLTPSINDINQFAERIHSRVMQGYNLSPEEADEFILVVNREIKANGYLILDDFEKKYT